jgi:hypothetical protein
LGEFFEHILVESAAYGKHMLFLDSAVLMLEAKQPYVLADLFVSEQHRAGQKVRRVEQERRIFAQL